MKIKNYNYLNYKFIFKLQNCFVFNNFLYLYYNTYIFNDIYIYI